MPPDIFRKITPALLSLPASPDGLGECIEFRLGGHLRYLNRDLFPKVVTHATPLAGGFAIAYEACRRLVALARLLVKPHFVGRISRLTGLNPVESLSALFVAGTTAPLKDEWSFEPGGFAKALRDAARRSAS